MNTHSLNSGKMEPNLNMDLDKYSTSPNANSRLWLPPPMLPVQWLFPWQMALRPWMNLRLPLPLSVPANPLTPLNRPVTQCQSQSHCTCHVCGKSFTRHWLLQGHMRTHTGERPFKCRICSKAFADKSNLRAHTQTHSGLKPHVCAHCGKAFALKSYLCKHLEAKCAKTRPKS